MIGEIENYKIKDSLRDDVNPFSQVLLPPEILPNITVSQYILEKWYTNKNFAASGFKV